MRKTAAIHVFPRSSVHRAAARNLAQGLTRHGYDCVVAGYNEPCEADLVAMWSGRQSAVIAAAQARKTPLLVMELGNLPPRPDWTCCGFNGMLRNGVYPEPLDGGARCRRHFLPTVQPWRDPRDGYALVIDQITGPRSLPGPFDHRWTEGAIRTLRQQGRSIRYRRHPSAESVGDDWFPEGLDVSARTLADDFAGAAFCVTYNSSVACEAIVAGVPSIAWDKASMAWDVTTHDLDAAAAPPDRTEWLNRLAWTQWRADEIASGDAWEALGPVAERLAGAVPFDPL